MPVPRLLIAFLLLAASAGPVSADADTGPTGVQVEVTGAVQRPGRQALPAGARLSDAILAATPRSEAYLLGAALLRRSDALAQTRDKAGLLFDLETLGRISRVSAAVADEARRLHDWLEPLPVTGRVRSPLEPRLLEIDPGGNRVLADGDRVVFPHRPETVQVIGAVGRHCELLHRPLQGAAAYLADCRPSEAADRDWIYLVQPDGHVEQLGVALWNRSRAQPLAPGAVIVVPLAEREVRVVNPGFNAQLAAFVATQVLPASGGEPR